MCLIDCLKEIDDPRRAQGQRYSALAMLLIIIMAMLRGKYGYREIGRFCARHKAELINWLGLKHNMVPSYVSIRDFIVRTDFRSVQRAFHAWAHGYVQIEQGEWLAVDGKSIRSTVSDYDREYQNFVSLVSLFSRTHEQVYHVERLENKKGNEGATVEALLKTLDIHEAVFTMDALHCKKNASNYRRRRQSLCGEGQKEPAKTAGGA